MSYLAIGWIIGGERMSRTHIGDTQTAQTLCGRDRRGYIIPAWYVMGVPSAPNSLPTLGSGMAEVGCEECWGEYCRRREVVER